MHVHGFDKMGSEFTRLGQNHLMALGFAVTGFLVAKIVREGAARYFGTASWQELKPRLIGVVATAVGLQTCISAAEFMHLDHSKSFMLGHKILIVYAAVLAGAAFAKQSKLAIGIALSGMCALTGPYAVAGLGAVAGAFIDFSDLVRR